MHKDDEIPQRKVKKLSLNTETLKNLDDEDLKSVAGGATTTFRCTCTHGCSGCSPCA
jgi:natural product precursor